MDIREELFNLQDLKIRDFTAKLIPNLDKEMFIGVRTPILRNFAKNLYKNNLNECEIFLNSLPHKYFEENNLHGFIIEHMKDLDKTLSYTEEFLPYIDNWATCDSFNPKIFKKHPEKIYEKIQIWIKDEREYTVRYAIGLLLSNFLDDEFREEHLNLVANVKRDEYYIKMMIAWYFSFALIKQYEKTIPFIENNVLDTWTHNKAIQKAIESYRIDKDVKDYLRELKIKNNGKTKV